MAVAEEAEVPADDSWAAFWLTAAWTMIGIDVVLALVVQSILAQARASSQGLVLGAIGVAGVLGVGMIGLVGFGCAIAGAAVAAGRGDRRFVVFLPAFAQAAFLMWFLISSRAPVSY
jgi:hypothetical protein